MNQSASIIVFLLIGFVVYVTVNGELPKYQAAILGASTATPSG